MRWSQKLTNETVSTGYGETEAFRDCRPATSAIACQLVFLSSSGSDLVSVRMCFFPVECPVMSALFTCCGRGSGVVSFLVSVTIL